MSTLNFSFRALSQALEQFQYSSELSNIQFELSNFGGQALFIFTAMGFPTTGIFPRVYLRNSNKISKSEGFDHKMLKFPSFINFSRSEIVLFSCSELVI